MAKILIVEDDVAFCQMLETFLTKKGYEVNASHTGNDALAKIKSNNYDIVLTDVRLPDRDGNEILQILKEEHPGMPQGVIGILTIS